MDPLQLTERILTAMPVFIFSLVVHEFAHAATAVRLGHGVVDYEERLTLNPMAHMDPIGSVVFPLIGMMMPGGMIFGWAKPVMWRPSTTRNYWRDSMLVSIAGPASNLLLMVFAAVLIRAMVGSGAFMALGALGGPLFGMLQYAIIINALLALFNMIPLPPLDGSKVLAYFLKPELAYKLVNLPAGPSMILVLLLVWQGALNLPMRWLTGLGYQLAGIG